MIRLQDLALAKKLAVIVIGLLLPSIWLLFKVVSTQQATINEADLKLEGLTYMHANWRLSAAIADHRALSAQFFSTKPEEVAAAAAKAKIADDVIAEIEKMEIAVDERLRIGTKWKELLELWHKLKDRNSGIDATQYYRQHTTLIDMIGEFNATLERQSTLLYEAEANPYYLIDAVVTNIPRAQNGILALRRAVATGSGAAGAVNPARMELSTNAGLVRLTARELQKEVDRVAELFPDARDDVSAALKDYVEAANRYAQSINDEMILADNRDKVLPRIIAEGGAAVKAAIALQDALIPILNHELKDRRSAAVFARNATILAFMVLVGLILMIERMLRRQINDSAQTVVTTMERMANGEVGQRLEVTSKDEFGRALAAVNRLDGKLAEVVAVIRRTADKVGLAAREISEGNHELSGRTQSQASALEQTASSMEQMTATVKQNADNAHQASQLASGVRQQAERGSVVVERATDAMSEINASSAKIADIIGVIDEIAFQTNLLALNAAVEAARAGEQGRGFAVVASEVRNLAQRSADAAKDIKNLIKDSVDKVKVGAELVSESGKTLAEIMASVRKVTDIVSEIAAASSEQSAGIDQVNNAVTQMDSVTQENAARVDEASNASKAMQQHTEELLQQISYFKVRNAAYA